MIDLEANPKEDPFSTLEMEESFLEKTKKQFFNKSIENSFEKNILEDPKLTFVKEKLTLANIWELEIPSIENYVILANDLCAEIQAEINNPVSSSFGNIEERAPHQNIQNPVFRGCGIGDLVFVREELLEYSAREIAHIENVQPGERYRRDFTRETEEITAEETEKYKEESITHDLQTSDRFEMETKSQETVSEDFSIDAGLNVSATYGMVTLESSLNASFSRSKSSSNSKAMKIAQEVIDKTVEKTKESFKERISKISRENIKETTIHEMDFTKIDKPYSSVYKWVEKSYQVELRHYGSRLMLEFYIPEPAMGILGSIDAVHSDIPHPPPFNFGPNQIDEHNYLCLAKIYKALDIEPPPPEVVTVGYVWASSPDEDAEGGGEDTHSGFLQIPELYYPFHFHIYSTGLRGLIDNSNSYYYLHVAIAGKNIFDGLYSVFFSKSGKFDSNFQFPTDTGIPVTIRARGHFDKTCTVNIQFQCKRRADLLTKWKINTYASLKEAHENLIREYEAKIAKAPKEVKGRHPLVNRKIEKGELAKWCITSLRNASINMDAIIKVKIDGDVKIEIDPGQVQIESSIIDFYESSFEWDQMTYFLYPYFWGRRELWDYKLSIKDSDPIHERFLQAGGAKVVVPVTPGSEERVLYFINPTNADLDETTRTQWNVPELYDDLSGELNISQMNLIDEILLSRSIELAKGIGTLSVKNDDEEVEISHIEDVILNWDFTKEDISRQIFIKGVKYFIVDYIDSTHFELDRKYEGEDDLAVEFLIGSLRLGDPWIEKIPTSMVILSDNVDKLKEK